MLTRPSDTGRFEAAFDDAASAALSLPGEGGEWVDEADALFRDIDGSAVRLLAAACRRRAGEAPAS